MIYKHHLDIFCKWTNERIQKRMDMWVQYNDPRIKEKYTAMFSAMKYILKQRKLKEILE